ncbi:MAG: tRNA 4-thiouridine(8) synthase ThiI [Clostridium sp.]|jgi:thiamine biosynthesis protein ThiI|nr:tRNA 4-thiouridine(8) synthase ThiI [Clostridium sp.]
MNERILIKFAPEIFLKGLNRKFFEDRLLTNIKAVLKGEQYKLTRDQQRWFILTEDGERIANKVARVFGVMEVHLVEEMEPDIELMGKSLIEVLNAHPKGTTFKVVTSRANKDFPLNSMEVSQELGGILLQNTEGYTVDVRKPDVSLKVEIRGKAYVYKKKIDGAKGMPYGVNGSTMLMLSGGIDSPVAGYLMAKRGVKLTGIYYHSHPYTSERAKDKVKELASILKQSTGSFRLIIPSFTEIQMAIMEKCPEDELTIIMRRFMMRLACAAAKKYKIQSVTTGESVGQVASQTMEALVVSDAVSDRPVFRPLVAMDKTDIIDIAHKIETFETSILPYEDCCTIFVPKHPKTKPRLIDIEAHEEALDVEGLVERALESAEVIEI